jgi:hypothetical protein
VTYQRVCFSAKAVNHHPDRKLDTGIVGAPWFTREELASQHDRWRSELVLQCIDDYLTGPVHSLDVVRD